jgi:RNA polymerase sigma-70 factor, ECF subfamily
MTIEELYNNYRSHILMLCRRYVRNPADAEDVVQSVFVKAWHSLDGFQSRSGYFTWLYRIGVNECLNYLKRHRKETLEFEETRWPVDSSDEFSKSERQELWKRVTSTLNRKERMIIFLYAVEGLSMVEVADVMTVSRQALYKRWNHIKTKVKIKMRGSI